MQEEYKNTAYHYPVFKGLGRKPTFMGIPTVWFLGAVSAVAFLSMLFGLYWWASLLVLLPTMAIITKTDEDRKSTRLNSSHVAISYAVFCLKKKKKNNWRQ